MMVRNIDFKFEMKPLQTTIYGRFLVLVKRSFPDCLTSILPLSGNIYCIDLFFVNIFVERKHYYDRTLKDHLYILIRLKGADPCFYLIEVF